ncbi:MAG: restriction endonuclease subunit S, partial [Candidatus Rifleibacteriota bacterium]
AILEKMAEELYREWFVRLRFPGHEKTKISKGIPGGWEIKRLGNIVNAIMGQSPPSEFYNQAGIGLPFNQGVGTYGQRYPQKIMFCKATGRIVDSGTILISVRAPVGRLNIADCKMIIGRGLAGLNHKMGLNSYLFYLLRDKFSTEDLIGNGSVFNSVTKDELLGLKILSPSKFLVEEFDKTVLPIDKSISIILKNNDCLKTSRDKLLSRLMSGKIDLENLDIQFPASMQEGE